MYKNTQNWYVSILLT